MADLEDFMAECEFAYAESTVKARRRELMQLCRQVDTLHPHGSISTDGHADLTLQDVKVIAASLKG